MSLAIIFNGQGAHYSEMGLDYVEAFPEAKKVYEKAEAITGYPIRQWIKADIDTLNQTQYAQVAITATSLAIYKSIESKLPAIHYMAGLSLGEYTSLIASGMVSFEQGMRLIQNRGQLMTSHCETLRASSDIAMDAVMKMPLEEIRAVINEVNSNEEKLYLANINSSTQVTVAGTTGALADFKAISKERGYKRMLSLKVEGPFHTPYMEPVCAPFKEALADVSFDQGSVPVISNTTVEPHTVAGVKELLMRHLVEPVRWQETIDYLVSQGVTKVIQIGPGKTLANLLKREKNAPETLVVDKISDLNEIERFLGG